MFVRLIVELLLIVGLAHSVAAQAAVAAAEPTAAGLLANAIESEQPQEKKETFDILEFEISGNTVLSKQKIEDVVYPFMGESKSVDDVEAARAALEKSFHDAGFLTVFVNIPEQKVEGGVVTLAVLEGKVDRLKILGSRYYTLGEIKSKVSDFAEGSVPNFTEVQKQLAAVNKSPDRKVTPVLRPSKTPGRVEVDLKVEDTLPVHASLELNNKYSYNTTETRLSGTVRYTNLWQKDHSLGVSFQITPQDLNEVKVLSATYVVPRESGDYFAAYAVVSKSNIGAVGDISVVGNGVIVGARYIRPLPSVPGYNHSLTAGIDYKDFQESVLLGADVSNNPIAYAPLSLSYDSNLNGESSITQLGAAVNFGIRGLGNDEKEFSLKRAGGRADYAYLKLSLKHTQKLYHQWQVVGRVSGQVSSVPLISNEQLGIGGSDTVRGYYESNSFGDQGVTGSFEVRSPSLAKYISSNINDLYWAGFVDAGYAALIDPLPAQTPNFNLSSVGAGLYMKALRGFSANVEFAQALSAASNVKSGDSRVLFRAGYDW